VILQGFLESAVIIGIPLSGAFKGQEGVTTRDKTEKMLGKNRGDKKKPC
jgi:hypothetical protein